MSIQTDISKPVSCSHQLEIKDKCILAVRKQEMMQMTSATILFLRNVADIEI